MEATIYAKDLRIAELEEELARQRTYNKINIQNFDLVENVICEATSQISQNFGTNLNILKEVCNKIESIDADGIISEELAQATKSMHEYISILQCEDRLFQILNGISSVSDSSIENIDNLSINDFEEEKFKLEMIPHYTIQDQRDIANNITIEEQIHEHSAGTLELF
jgi:hypothetical protein